MHASRPVFLHGASGPGAWEVTPASQPQIIATNRRQKTRSMPRASGSSVDAKDAIDREEGHREIALKLYASLVDVEKHTMRRSSFSGPSSMTTTRRDRPGAGQ